MKSFESTTQESQIAEDVDVKIRDLLDGPPSSDYNRRQMQLAVERFVTQHPEETLDHDRLREIMKEWATPELSKLSKGFSDIARHPAFKTHPRFQGDVSNITVHDVQYCIETGKIPEF
jgi:hypothetical protein